MKAVVSVLGLVLCLQLHAATIPLQLFLRDYWKHYEYFREKQQRLKMEAIFSQGATPVNMHNNEKSLLQQKLLSHEIAVPQFFKPFVSDTENQVAQYLKRIIFSKQDPKKIFPDISRRPLSYVPNFITESFYRFGISVPL